MPEILIPSRAVVSYLASALFALLAALHVILPPSFTEPGLVAAVMLAFSAMAAVLRFAHPGDAGADAKEWWQSKSIWTAIVSAGFAIVTLFGAAPAIDQGDLVAFVLLASSLAQAILHPGIAKPIAPIADAPGAMSFFVGGLALAGVLACTTLTGCATVGAPATPGQQVYAALGGYKAALVAATDYAESPSAKPAVVHRLDAVNKTVAPVAQLADAYRLCAAGAVAVGDKACTSFDFNPATLIADAQKLRDAAASLQER